jgi:hypothetical protein
LATQQILVLLFLVRARVSQPKRGFRFTSGASLFCVLLKGHCPSFVSTFLVYPIVLYVHILHHFFGVTHTGMVGLTHTVTLGVTHTDFEA